MILTLQEVKAIPAYATMTDAQVTRKIEAVESAICAITNNDFINRVTRQKAYPPDVVEGALVMLMWQVGGGAKARDGISSETLSRHSVTYADANGEKTFGFPKTIIGFLTPYMKARF